MKTWVATPRGAHYIGRIDRRAGRQQPSKQMPDDFLVAWLKGWRGEPLEDPRVPVKRRPLGPQHNRQTEWQERRAEYVSEKRLN